MVNIRGPNKFKIMTINGIGTKRALNVSLVGWVILCFAALSFAPLEYTDHTDYQVQVEEVDGEWFYTPHANILDTPIALVDGGDEQIWAESALLSWGIVQQNEDISDAVIYEWAGFDDDGNAVAVSIGPLAPEEITSLTSLPELFEDTRFSISIRDTSTMVGIDHPTNLGDGVIDFIPETVRDKVWGPLGVSVGIQFLILGCAMGTLLGGSQG